MKFPKRFKLHEVAELDDTNVHLLDIGLVSSSTNGIAIVPVTSILDDKDMPKIEITENRELEISSKAIKEAVKGKTSTGEIIFRKKDVMVRSGENKNWILMPHPESDSKSTTCEIIEKLTKQLTRKSPKGYHYAEVCLDAELLSTFSRSIGTSKVRLRFLVNAHSKIADGQGSNLIHITPYRKDGNGEEAILSMLLTNK